MVGLVIGDLCIGIRDGMNVGVIFVGLNLGLLVSLVVLFLVCLVLVKVVGVGFSGRCGCMSRCLYSLLRLWCIVLLVFG